MEDQHTRGNDAAEGGAREPQKGQKPSSKKFVWIIIVVVIAGVLFWLFGSGDRFALLEGTDARNDEVVAIVNGEDVLRSDFEQNLEQATQIALQQGLDPESEEGAALIREQALSVAVNTRLLVQAAEDSGITASDNEVAESVGILEAQLGGVEAFEAQLASLGLSSEDVRKNIRDQLIIDAYVRQSDEFANVSVTEEEIASFYDTMEAQNEGDIPPFETLAPQIEQQLLVQQQQEVAFQIITRLREEADIEVLL